MYYIIEFVNDWFHMRFANVKVVFSRVPWTEILYDVRVECVFKIESKYETK